MRKFLLFLLILLAINLSYGGTSGKITGIITDISTGLPLAGVNVVVSGTSIGAASGTDGHFVILNVSPGEYELRVMMMGYQTVTVKEVLVSIDLTTKINVEMNVTVLEAGEEIIVLAEKPLLKQDEFASKHMVSSEEMQVQPVDNIINIAKNQAGVVGNNFRGGRAGEVLVVIDGIPVRDPAAGYTGDMGGFSLGIPKEAVKEMEVSLGGFSAEYGNVQSGVLNLAMNEGSKEYHASFHTTTTDFGSLTQKLMKKDDWWFDAKYQQKLENNYRFNLSGPVPLLSNLTFSVSGDIFDKTQGYFLNQKEHRQSYQGKVSLKISDKAKFSIGGNYTKKEWDSFYFQAGKYGPGDDFQSDLYEFYEDLDADNDTLKRYLYVDDAFDTTRYQQGLIDSLENPYYVTMNDSDSVAVNFHKNYYLDSPINHLTSREKESNMIYGVFTYTLSPKTYMEFRGQIYNSSYMNGMRDYADRDGDGDRDEYLQWDSAIDGPRPLDLEREYQFWWLRGDDREFRDQKVNSYMLKWDMTSQVNKNHMLKTGLQFNLNNTDVTDITWSSVGEGTDFSLNTLRKDIWNDDDLDFGAYVQDKMEYDNDLVALVGLRFDYFNPNGFGDRMKYPGDMVNPIQDYDENGEAIFSDPKEAKARYQLSPRIGLSYPISDRDVMFFSYGHYFQRPDGRYIFRNHQYRSLTKVGNWVGNPSLTPEKTVAYEVSFEHLITKNLKMSVTSYFKDVTDLINNQKFVFPDGTEVWQYVNGDYANIKGAELTLKRLRSDFWSLQANISYSIAKGRNSSANGVSLYPYDKTMYYLDYDRRISSHLNLTLYSNDGLRIAKAITRNWIMNLQYDYGTGKPFSTYGEQGATNDRRLPDYTNLDLRIHRSVNFGKSRLNLFLDIFNVLNNDVHYDIYTKYYDETKLPNVIYKEELSGLEILSPSIYPAERQYKIGISINL